MRISDWSSDVCSSDLVVGVGDELVQQGARPVCPQRQHPLRRIAQRPPGARRDILRVGQVEQRVADPLSAALRQAERRLAEFERRGETAFARTLVYERDTERTLRSAERRVGKECVSKCRSRWSALNAKN